MDRKLVSVITGTYNRPLLLSRCIDEVRKQSYPNIEHCIASDGPNPLLRQWHNEGWPTQHNTRSDVPIKFVEAGRHWSSFLASSISAVPYRMAQDMSSGDYLMWFADDEEISVDHIEKLVNLLETEDVDFVYSKSEIWFNLDGFARPPDVVGAPTPKNGNITHALYRAELLDYCGFNTHVGSGTDWDQISHWMAAGASWAFLPEITHTHRVDKLGDSKLNNVRQPLRGHKNKVEFSWS
jgi:hypothetical protein